MPKRLLRTADESEIAAVIRKALGVGPNEDVGVETPQFERIDGREPAESPVIEQEFDMLKTLSESELRDAGLQPWDEDHVLWLFPAEWYPHIPEGYPVTDIFGETEPFSRDSSNDQRFGALSYGIEVH